jgi:Arc/MetJ-type ribon-helix-helix transcriptional regulator
MKAITLELPEMLAAEVDRAVQAGWFVDAQEAIREALREYLDSRRLELQELQQLEDISWAMQTAVRP